MLQYHFAHPPTLPAPTASLNVMSMHKRNNRFTERIITHGGPKRDTTIDATTKHHEREKKAFEKKFNVMDAIQDEFEEEMNKIEIMRQQIVANQLYMAKCAHQHYSALTIQQAFRASQARYALTVLMKLRLVRCWLHFRRYFRQRVRASRYIVMWLRKYFARRRFHIILIQYKAAKRIQTAFRAKKSYLLLRVCLTLLGQVKKTRDHILLFAQRKAFKRITLLRLPAETKPNPIIQFMQSCIRRRRMRLLKTQQGKVAFYVLNNFYNEGMYQPNATIDFIRKKVYQAVPQLANSPDDKARRRQSPSPRGPNRVNMRNSGQSSPGGTSAVSMVANLSAADLPGFFSNGYRIRSVADAFFLIKDMIKAAIANPILIDDSVLPLSASKPGSSQTARRNLKSPGLAKNADSTASLGKAAAAGGKNSKTPPSKSGKSMTTISKQALKSAQQAKASPGEKTPRPKSHTISGNNYSLQSKSSSIPDLQQQLLTSVTERDSDDSDNDSVNSNHVPILKLRSTSTTTSTTTAAAAVATSKMNGVQGNDDNSGQSTNGKSEIKPNASNKGKSRSFDTVVAAVNPKAKNKGTRSSTSDISSLSGSIKSAVEAARAAVADSTNNDSTSTIQAPSKNKPTVVSITKKQLDIKEVRRGSRVEITIEGDPSQNLLTDSSSDSIARSLSRNPSKATLLLQPSISTTIQNQEIITIEGDLNQPLISDSSSESVVRNLSKHLSKVNLTLTDDITSPSSSMLKTEFLSSLAYSDDGSSVADTPFKHLMSTQTSMTSQNPLSQSLQSNVSNYYIAGEEEDSDSDFDFEIPDNDMNELLGLSQDNQVGKDYENYALSRKHSAFGIDAEPSLVDTVDFKITKDDD